jgi:hypothetical protein
MFQYMLASIRIWQQEQLLHVHMYAMHQYDRAELEYTTPLAQATPVLPGARSTIRLKASEMPPYIQL